MRFIFKNGALHQRNCLEVLGAHSPAGAGRALGDAHEESGGADLLELGLLAGVQEDHGKSEVERDPQTVHHLLAQILAKETKYQPPLYLFTGFFNIPTVRRVRISQIVHNKKQSSQKHYNESALMKPDFHARGVGALASCREGPAEGCCPACCSAGAGTARWP